MPLFRRLVFAAVLAGVGAGLVATLLHQRFTVPLILQAEMLEVAEDSHGASTEAAWQPRTLQERAIATATSDVRTGIAYGLLLVALWQWRGFVPNWPQGIGWGMAGFLVTTVAPSLGLPATLPGVPESALAPRQAWWIGTVLASGVGLYLACFGRVAWLRVAGLLVLLVPHLVGAPAPPTAASPVPRELSRVFQLAVYLCNFHFWLALGLLASFVYRPRNG